MQTLLPRLALKLESGRDTRTYFPPACPAGRDNGAVRDAWLEIGFGGGEHLLWQAQAHSDIGMIGAEPYQSGVAKFLSRLASRSEQGNDDLTNIWIYQDDARDILKALPDRSLGRVFLLFPDPWPKTRHHKRRFLQMATLDELARVMTAGAELRFATDDRSYFLWALERLMSHPAFGWQAQSCRDWQRRPEDWPQTRYEAKAVSAGRACAYLQFQRREL